MSELFIFKHELLSFLRRSGLKLRLLSTIGPGPTSLQNWARCFWNGNLLALNHTLKYATCRCEKWKITPCMLTSRIDLPHTASLQKYLESELEIYHPNAFSDRPHEQSNVATFKSKQNRTRIMNFLKASTTKFKAKTIWNIRLRGGQSQRKRMK